jgi:hypothetical protein
MDCHWPTPLSVRNLSKIAHTGRFAALRNRGEVAELLIEKITYIQPNRPCFGRLKLWPLLMGYLMKNGIATYSSLSREYYVLQINGRLNSTHRRYQDA